MKFSFEIWNISGIKFPGFLAITFILMEVYLGLLYMIGFVKFVFLFSGEPW